MINTIILGHAPIELKKLPSELVNCCVCSPPYWGLRDYCIEPVIWDGDRDCKHIWGNKAITLKHKSGETNPGKEGWFKDRGASDDKGNCFCLRCGAWKGSLGLEPDFNLYVKHLCDIFDEIKRILRKDGTCWVNLGDSYAGSGKGIGTDRTKCKESYSDGDIKRSDWQNINISTKSLCLMPQRFAIEMVNRGWVARNVLIWWKPNCMPSSAKDRFTVDFEYVYFFVKSKNYWFEQQFEEYIKPLNRWSGNNLKDQNKSNWEEGTGQKIYRDRNMRPNDQGRNKRAVWTIPTQPFPEAHFAVYPETLIEPMIRAGCPEFVCKKCGKARVKIYQEIDKKYNPSTICTANTAWNNNGTGKSTLRGFTKKEEIGYSDCGCNAGWEGGIVLDPFIGAGTTALVALKQRKRFIGIEIKQEYIDMSNKRIARVQQEIF